MAALAMGLLLPAPLGGTATPEALRAARGRLQASGLGLPLKAPAIWIFKGDRRLELRSAGRVVRTWRVGLGADPGLDKVREGDHRTPEGDFHVCLRQDQSRFHLFLGVSYPGPEAADRGFKAGLITREDRARILAATARTGTPPWNTRLGGTVGIHGGGSGADWTWGCIALDNESIEELWVACPVGTPIHIRN